MYPCSICVGELGSIPLASLVTSACNPWDIPGPFCCILNLHLTRPRSTQLRYHVKIQRPKLPTRRNAKTLGSAARAKNPTTQPKKNLPLKHTVRLSQVPTFAPANRRKQQSLSLFPVLCFDSCLNQAWLVLSLEMKNARQRMHLLLRVL